VPRAGLGFFIFPYFQPLTSDANSKNHFRYAALPREYELLGANADLEREYKTLGHGIRESGAIMRGDCPGQYAGGHSTDRVGAARLRP
jgi:hypothetical protein